ncbi:MAG: hypothetical protein AB7N65_04015 [Vicinamibacterales bacterium]
MGIVLLSIGIVAAIMLAMAFGQRLTGRCLHGSCGGAQPGTARASDISCDVCPMRSRSRQGQPVQGPERRVG